MDVEVRELVESRWNRFITNLEQFHVMQRKVDSALMEQNLSMDDMREVALAQVRLHNRLALLQSECVGIQFAVVEDWRKPGVRAALLDRIAAHTARVREDLRSIGYALGSSAKVQVALMLIEQAADHSVPKEKFAKNLAAVTARED